MKKIFLLVFAFVMCKIGYAQYPMTQFIGTDSAIVVSKGAMQSRFVNVVFADTTTANSQRIKQYPGAMIYAAGKLWYRNATATGWVELTSTSTDTNIYNSDGILTGNRDVDADGKDLNFIAVRNFRVDGDTASFLQDQNIGIFKAKAGTQEFLLSDSLARFIRTNNAGVLINSTNGSARLVLNPQGPVDEKKFEVVANNEEFWIAQINDSETIKDTIVFVNAARNVGVKTVNVDSALTVGGGIHATGGLRLDKLPTSPGTKALRINGNGVVSVADTSSLSGFVPYVGATQNVNLGQFGLKTEYVEFDTTLRAPADRTLSWNNDDGTLNLGMTNGGSITQKVGLQQFARVKNVDNVQINKGQAVYIFGASGDRASVKRAFNKADSASSKVLGVAAENIPVNDVGLVGTFGTISNLNLAAFNPGDILYLDSVPGQLTATKPQAPYHLVFVGVVERANAGNGLLFVNPQNGYELEELHNVRITSPVPNNAILSYDSVAKLWKDTTLNAIGGITGSGTINYIPKFTSSSAIGNSSIIENTFSIVSSKDIGVKDAGSSSNFNVSNYSVGAQLGAFDGGGYGRVGTYTNHDFIFMTNTTERMRLNASGNLGLGTSSPYDKFVVSGANNGAIVSESTSSTGSFVRILGDISNQNLINWQDGTALRFATSTRAYASFVERMRLDASGNLGLGTSSPSVNFQINSATGNDATIGLSVNNSLKWYLRHNAGNGNFEIVDIPALATRMTIDASGNLGIGTSNPAYKLDVNGAIRIIADNEVARFQSSDANGNYIAFRNNSSAFGFLGSNYHLVTGGAASDLGIRSQNNIVFLSGGGIEQMRLTSSGNLGIGTSSPQRKLDVLSNGVLFANSTGAHEILFGDNNYRYFGIYTPSSPDYFSFRTGTTDLMTLTASGNLGLGVTPSAWSASFTAMQMRAASFFGSTSQSEASMSANAFVNTSGQFAYINSTVASLYQQVNAEHRWFTAPSGTAGNAISFTQAMTLDASGNLGIGTTNPGYKLDINGGARLNSGSDGGLLQFNYGVSGLSRSWRIWNDVLANGDFSISQSTTQTGGTYDSKFYINSSGNVGIGTTSPTYKLQVTEGGISFGGADKSLLKLASGTTTELNIIQRNVSGFTGSILSSSDALLFETSATERMRITSGGNVGIGVTNPASYNAGGNQLVIGGGAFRGLTIAGTTEGNIYFADGTTGTETYRGSVGYNHTSDYLFFYSAANERMRITSGGNVGIGTTSPSVKLQVVGDGLFNSNTNTNLTINSNGGIATLTLTNGAGSQAIYGGVGGSNNMDFYTNSTYRMRIDASGNLLIATTSPSYNTTGRGNITIGGSSSSILGLQVGGVAKGYVYHDNVNYFLWNTANGYMGFGTNDTERMRITSGGELLINTTSDAGDYKLQVNGNGYFSQQLTANTTNGATSAIFANTGLQNSNGIELRGGTTGTSVNWKIEKDNITANGLEFTPSTTNGGTTYTTPSLTITSGGAIKTAAPSGGTAATWKLGSKVSATVSLVTTDYIEVEIGGVAYKLAIVN